jgi:hypothetical protein
MKIITTGHIFLRNYELSRFLNNQVNLYEFVFFATQVQTTVQNITKFLIIEFQINQVLLYSSMKNFNDHVQHVHFLA